jgi:antirestriction protein ArdC
MTEPVEGEHHSAVIEYWGSAPLKPKPGEEVIEDPDKPGLYRFPEYYQLFNAEQIEGIHPLELKKHDPWEVVESGEAILNKTLAPSSGMVVRARSIQRPMTAVHELAHWSGSGARAWCDSNNYVLECGSNHSSPDRWYAEMHTIPPLQGSITIADDLCYALMSACLEARRELARVA